MARRVAWFLLVSLLLGACGDGGEAAATVDSATVDSATVDTATDAAGETTSSDTAPADTAPTDAASSDGGDGARADGGPDAAPMRRLVSAPILAGLPVDNRILDAVFDAVLPQHFGVGADSGGVTLQRVVSVTTPLPAPALRIQPGQSGRTLHLYGMCGEGRHRAAVYVGRDAGDPLAGVTASVVGLTLAGADTLPGAVDLAPVLTLDQEPTGSVTWSLLEVRFDARTGPCVLVVRDEQPGEALRVHAPTLTREAGALDPTNAAERPRAPRAAEREAWRRATSSTLPKPTSPRRSPWSG